MKKIIFFLAIASMAMSSLAAVKLNDNLSMGFKLRTRADMNNLGSYNADAQVWNRSMDYRFRPYFDFTLNKYISAKAAFEIGDSPFGVEAAGTDIDADGRGIIEVKQVYVDIAPSKKSKFRAGIQYWEDGYGLMFGDEAAGLMYYGNYGKLQANVGWFIPDDRGEANVDESTVSYGDNLIISETNYQINKDMKFGLDIMLDLARNSMITGAGETYDQLETSLWVGPEFEAKFGKGYLNTKFVYYMMSGSYEEDNTGFEFQGDDPEASGFVVSLKGGYDFTKKVGMNLDFLFTPGDEEGKDFYKSFMVPTSNWMTNWYCAGSEILSHGVNDAADVDLVNLAQTNGLGLMMPTLNLWYKFNDTAKLNGGFAMGMSTEDGFDGETNYGMEFYFNAELNLYKGLFVQPYFAMLMPGKALTNSDDTDPVAKTGFVAKVSL